MDNSEVQAIADSIDSICSIIRDIIASMNHTLNDNLHVLKNASLTLTVNELEELLTDMKEVGQESIKLQTFRETAVECLVGSPTKISIGRVAGLMKVLNSIKIQVILLKNVSSGNRKE